MKINDAYLEKRIQKDLNIAEPVYLDGLLDITQTLVLELEKLLDTEGRKFGIMISYLDSMFEAFTKAEEGVEESTYEIYEKILYLYKPLILKEYRKLRRRNLSKADCIIVILKRVLEVITEKPDWEHVKNARTIHKIVTKLFDNIRNTGKKASLSSLTGYIENYLDLGVVGKYRLDHISIEEEETKYQKTELLDSGSRVEAEDNKVEEISWTDD